GYVLRQKGKQRNSMTLQANGQHLISDAWTSLGLLVGLALVYFTDFTWLDNLLGIFFGVYILWMALRILRRSVAGIMDEADFNLLNRMVKLLNDARKPHWIDIHNLRVIQYGSTLHIDCHVTLPWYYELNEAHDAIKEIDEIIYSKYESVELFIHMDPCIPDSCRVCSLHACKVRKKEFEGQQEWKLNELLRNAKHGVPLSS
ncbi:MAG: cation diffusion facilitator family transporter, partial [Bacteroidota bacterium]|nr:cation diffusion facilitator family transporter [Bacteroidota bacterium]MDX5431434.1 cation diffusion facilitator family transporter [Bacteroidota bacterium]MDX5470162.1 cation diffusion facilitator family transporter [Bacteroidota bacterium]